MKKPIIYERDGSRSFTNLNAISDETWAKMRKHRESAEKVKDKDRSQSYPQVPLPPVGSKEKGEEVKMLTTSLKFIAHWGGKNIDGISCNGSWCAEMARSSLNQKGWEELRKFEDEIRELQSKLDKAKEALEEISNPTYSTVMGKCYVGKNDVQIAMEALKSISPTTQAEELVAAPCPEVQAEKKPGWDYSDIIKEAQRAKLTECMNASPAIKESLNTEVQAEKEATAEEALEWYVFSEYKVLRADGGYVVRYWSPEGMQSLGRGVTCLEAIRSAMNAEKIKEDK